MSGRGGWSLALPILLAAAAVTGCVTDADPGTVRDAANAASAGQPSERVDQLEQRRQRAARRERRRDARRARLERAARQALRGLGSLAAKLDAEVGVSVRAAGGAGESVSAGSLQSGSAWSTIKVPIALRVLEDAGGPAGLSDRQRADIDAAISASDNDAAARLYDDLSRTHGGAAAAAAAVNAVLERAGDPRTRVSTVGRDGFSPYGQTEWPLEAQGRFMAALVGGCVGDRASRRLLFVAMRNVTADRWGLGTAGAEALWKGGWGPGADGRYLVRQMGAVELGGAPVVVTLAARASDGTFEGGTAAASAVARWLVERLPGIRPSARPCGAD